MGSVVYHYIDTRPRFTGKAEYSNPPYSGAPVGRHGLQMKIATEAAGRLSHTLNGLATDLDTEHGGTERTSGTR